MNKKNQHLVLIDGYGFLFRAFHAFPPLLRSDGINVGAIYGFTSMLTKVILEFSCSHLAVVLDSGGKTFRHEIFSEYKSHRPPAPEDLIPQFPLVREALNSLNICILEKQNYEADDLIATFAKAASNQGLNTTIISSDKDLMQLIDDNISLYDPIKAKYIKHEQVAEKFGVRPDQVIDILALIGDSADFVPGVPGIGPKTAAELIQKYESLDGIYQNIDLIPASKRKESLIANKDIAYLSQKLVVLDDNVIMEANLTDLQIKIAHVDQFKDFLKLQNFASLYNRAEKICQAFFSKNQEHHNPLLSIKINEFNNNEDLAKWIKKEITKTCQISIILEAGYLCIATGSQEVGIVEIKPNNGLFNSGISLNNLASIIAPYLDDLSISKITHNCKSLYQILGEYVSINENAWQADDVQLMSYVLNNGVHSHDLKTLVQTYFEIDENIEFKQWLAYCSTFIIQLWMKFKQRLAQEKLLIFYQRVEKPLSSILFNMEKTGIKIDPSVLTKISGEFDLEIAELERKIYQIAGCEFNIGSPKQLAEILFDKLGLQAQNNKKSTNADVLEQLEEAGNSIATLIINWRHLSKLNNTYAKTLGNDVDSENRIHTSFQMTITSTGRLSSIHPNLQNIPIRSEDGIKIRSAFVAKPGSILLSADYSQVELRILAHMADIETLKQAFLNKTDIHTATASDVFEVELSKVTSELRQQAKAINFGIIYGISGFGLAKQLNINKADASKYIEKYFNRYPGILQYMEITKENARKNGYVETLLGRRCFTKNINDSNFITRNLAERAAINAPIQGTAADIIKKAMIELNKELLKEQIPAQILLQIHDELILEVSEDYVGKVSALTKQVMESASKLSIPLVVDINYGKNWAEI